MDTTSDSRIAANNLFDSMAYMCKTASQYYKPINKTKTENYTMYGIEGKPVIRLGIVKAMKTKSPKTRGIKATTRFKLKTTSGTSLQYFFGVKKGSVPTSFATTVDFNKKVFTTTTAARLGYSKAKGMIVLNILNINGDDAGYLVRMGG